MRPILALLFGVLVLAGCSKPQAPAGRWEGGYDQGGTFVAARLEIEPDGKVRVSAPDVSDPGVVSGADRAMMRRNMAERLAGGWGDVAPRAMSFDGTIFRRPGGIAPYIEYDKTSNVMTLYVYLGTNPVIKLPLKPVGDFSDDPF